MCGEKFVWHLTPLISRGSPPRVRGKGSGRRSRSTSARITPACAGKSFAWSICSRSCLGSPPRVRGKALPVPLRRAPCRITPACAGKRQTARPCSGTAWDHPRVCGEKDDARGKSIDDLGSPPRVRGKVRLFCDLLNRLGITPACAGKSASSAVTSTSARDHPRVCGEKAEKTPAKPRAKGSPPRVRGKEPKRSVAAVVVGITPACAGKRAFRSMMFQPLRDHPRVCGEKWTALRLAQTKRGSPPRVRGKD